MKDEEEKINVTKGDKQDTIDSLISYLQKSKELGATHYRMYWSQDPIWSFKWFRTFRIRTKEEMKQIKIDELQKEINEIKGI